ncbi:ATP-binding protein [Gluconobacter japonicus]|uniref:ATP-binding protein n=1 Tax=Gluconobacter japonicus TaxID=376620 RepID=UPI0007845EA4|nr:ATP-binding protein [Gluconobacter japonicus]KXV22203.1 histidine kinase [Gluconobacter japonicus]
MKLLPGSLVARTSLVLIVGLAVIELAGLGIHALDRLDMAERSEMHDYQMQAFSIYRTIAETKPEDRQAIIDDLHIPSNTTVLLRPMPDQDIHSHKVPLPFFPPPKPAFPDHFRPGPNDPSPRNTPFEPPNPMQDGPYSRPPADMEPFPAQGRPPFPHSDGPDEWRLPNAGERHRFQDNFPGGHWPFLPAALYPREIWSGQELRTHSTSLLLPDTQSWVVVRYVMPLPNPFDAPTFIVAFLVMSLCGGALIVWATRRLILPVTTLANAAEALGRDVNSSTVLPENGPSEIRRAAVAFNTMSMRIRRFVSDRTLMLTAIGHDLRTPITRLKLRAEFIDDDELRTKMLADLDEMEAMVAATLAFGRDSASNEQVVSLDLRALLQTIMDEAAEAYPDQADSLAYESPSVPVRIMARSVALKRALNNLILNALKYGNSAHVTLIPPNQKKEKDRYARIIVEDNGPGLPDDELDRVFEPFVRIETSRNRETGGTGLGLSIARTILRAQGGDVRLMNRPEGGLRAIITLEA